jgi:glycyl-tRNA synthetase
LELPLYTSESQKNAAAIQRMTLGDAVANKVIANETLGFFIGRIYEFMRLIGVNTERCARERNAAKGRIWRMGCCSVVAFRPV